MKQSSKTQFTILGMLTIAPMSGYDIGKMISMSTTHFWSESDGQIYPTLKRLESEKSIRVVKAQKQAGRARKVYALTGGGRKKLLAWLKEEDNSHIVRNELLLKLFFANSADKYTITSHINKHMSQVKSKLSTFDQIENNLKRNEADSPHLNYWLMTIGYGKAIANAKLKWCKSTLNTLGR